jgi:hypothetical protein
VAALWPQQQAPCAWRHALAVEIPGADTAPAAKRQCGLSAIAQAALWPPCGRTLAVKIPGLLRRSLATTSGGVAMNMHQEDQGNPPRSSHKRQRLRHA